LLILALASCETAIYYPLALEPHDDWVSACEAPIDGTVVVRNDGERPVDVDELLPELDCAPTARGTVGAGETAELGVAAAPIWRIHDAETRESLGVFTLVDGENRLVVP
jgi:hypothetical protein